MAESDEAEVETPVAKRPRLPQLRLKRIRAILTRHVGCEWSMAKGSERNVHRQGSKQFTFGSHGLDPQVHPVQIKNCLGKLRNFARGLHRSVRVTGLCLRRRRCHHASTWQIGSFSSDGYQKECAVERGDRRHRKMQNAVYRVRTQEHIHDRIALEMFRESTRKTARPTP